MIDLTAATFLDSCVMRELVRAQARAQRDHTALAVVLPDDPSHIVRRAIEVAGLVPYLPFCASLPLALARVAPPATDRP